MAPPCGKYSCRPCGRYKVGRVAKRFAELQPDFLMTVSLPRSAWATPENLAELQMRLRWLLRYMQRHALIEAYGWVLEVGAPRDECICLTPEDAARRGLSELARQGCGCGVNGGRQLHRHYVIRLSSRARNRYGRPWLPYERLQAAALRCGLGTLDFQPIFNRLGAVRYVTKYLTKSLAESFFATRRRFACTEPAHKDELSDWAFANRRVARVAVELLGAIAVDWNATYWSADAPP